MLTHQAFDLSMRACLSLSLFFCVNANKKTRKQEEQNCSVNETSTMKKVDEY